jgi:N-acetylglucosamine kinase-like BadF-type ATPase
MILGIDVGGTHTDAVLIESGRIRKRPKSPLLRIASWIHYPESHKTC